MTAIASGPPRLFVRKTSGLIPTTGIGGAVWPGADDTLASRTLSPSMAPARFALVPFSGLVAGSLVAWTPTVALPA